MADYYVDKNAGPHAAKIAGGAYEMDLVAARTLRAVKIAASRHRNTGSFINSLKVKTVPSRSPSRVGYVQDRVIVSDDPGALAIEFGHMVRHKNARRVTWVPGQHNFRTALQMVS